MSTPQVNIPLSQMPVNVAEVNCDNFHDFSFEWELFHNLYWVVFTGWPPIIEDNGKVDPVSSFGTCGLLHKQAEEVTWGHIKEHLGVYSESQYLIVKDAINKAQSRGVNNRLHIGKNVYREDGRVIIDAELDWVGPIYLLASGNEDKFSGSTGRHYGTHSLSWAKKEQEKEFFLENNLKK